jgi:hypothetical protein
MLKVRGRMYAEVRSASLHRGRFILILVLGFEPARALNAIDVDDVDTDG